MGIKNKNPRHCSHRFRTFELGGICTDDAVSANLNNKSNRFKYLLYSPKN